MKVKMRNAVSSRPPLPDRETHRRGPAPAPTAPVLLLLCAMALWTAGCHRSDEPRPAAPPLPTAKVRVQSVEAQTVTVTEEVVGSVRARLQARLEAKVAGRIAEMRAVPGQAVKAGEPLARLEVQEIRARLDQALATQQQTASDLKRYTPLVERGAATPAEFDAVQARARTADAAVKEAQTMLGYAEIPAPFNGVITRKLADVGDLAAPGKPLLEMEDPAGLRLEADLPEAMLGRVKPGATMAVHVSGLAPELNGIVSEIAPAADPDSRTFRIKLDLPANSGARSGQFGRVAVPVAESTVLQVPTSAVLRRGQLDLIFVVIDQRAVLRLVRPGRRTGDKVEIASGLAVGDRVVVDNAASLVDGQPVDIQP